MNNTNTTDIHFNLELTFYLNAAVSIVICFFAIFGNLVIMSIYISYKRLRSLNNLVVTFLSFADFLRGSIVMTIKIYDQFSLSNTLVEPFCTITAVVSAFTFVYSPLLLALIAFIRYSIIVPSINHKFKLTGTRLHIILGCIMGVALLFSFLPIFGLGQYVYSIHHGVCFAPWVKKNRSFRTIFYTLVFGISFPILTVCYTKLYLVLRKHKLVMKESLSGNRQYRVPSDLQTSPSEIITKSYSSIPNATPSISIDVTEEKVSYESKNEMKENGESKKCASIFPIHRRKSSQIRGNERELSKRKARKEQNVTNIMIIIFISYCICWVPAAIVNIVALANPHTVNDIILIVIVTLVELKSGIDPLIYGYGNREYRKAFKKMALFSEYSSSIYS